MIGDWWLVIGDWTMDAGLGRDCPEVFS